MSGRRGRVKWHSRQLPSRVAREREADRNAFAGQLFGQAADGSGLGAEGASDMSGAVASPISDMYMALHMALRQLTSSQDGERGEDKLAPAEEAEKASLVRSLQAVLDSELRALQEVEDESSSPNPCSANIHKQKLRKRLEALRRGALDVSPAQEGSRDWLVQRKFRAFNPVGDDALQDRHFSWDSEQYSVEELLEVRGNGAADSTGGVSAEADLVKLRDQVMRETISLPALLTADEVDAAAHLLPTLTASAAKGPLFNGHRRVASDPPLCSRRPYGLPQLLKDLTTTFALVTEERKQSSADNLRALSAARQEAEESTAVSAPISGPQSLFPFFPELSRSGELLGAAYCARLDVAADVASRDKRRGIVLLPGKLQPRWVHKGFGGKLCYPATMQGLRSDARLMNAVADCSDVGRPPGF